MEVTPLAQGWKFIDTAWGEGDAEAFSRPGLDTAGWLDIAVPGDVNDCLVRAGRMPDPHVGDNGLRCHWVTSRDWWLRLEFAGPAASAARTDLVLDGIDGPADLYLNGQLLDTTRNAFRKFRFDVAGRLVHGANVLLLRFHSLDHVLGGPREDNCTGWIARRVLVRKPQYNMGWDWCLPLPSIGVMNSVTLEQHDGARFLDVGVRTHLTGRIDVHYRLVSPPPKGEYEVAVRVTGHGADVTAGGKCLGGRSYVSLQVPDVQWWYPHGMGPQPLYAYEVELRVGGRVVDCSRGRVGFREVRVLEEPFTPEAGHGMSFWLVVNGHRVFCKGGNWVPLHLWPALATEEEYRFYLGKTVDANFNIQRIWGGGIYECEIFYELCDELGIMVWQDFMFASHGYPVELLRDEIIAETDYQIRRLRNHACLALWCGINEDVYSWGPAARSDYSGAAPAAPPAAPEYIDGCAAGSLAGQDRRRDDPQIYSMICRGTVSRLGFEVPFVESSPTSHDDWGNCRASGNSHESCWKYCLFSGRHTAFREQFEPVCSFDSEFCIQGPPSLRTMEQMLPAGHRWPPDEVWRYHIQIGHANIPHYEQHIRIAGDTFGAITDLQTYCKHGQATHAEHMRAEFESARRDRPNNGGTMMWMFNDSWPTSNWSIIDYFRRPKASYYAAKRACAPQLPIVFERGGKVEFLFSNDSPGPVGAELTFGQSHLDGTVVWSRTAAARCGGCETVMLHRMDRASLTLAEGDYLWIDAQADGQALDRVTYFPNLWKGVAWPEPNVKLAAAASQPRGDRWQTELTVTAEAYARLCHLIAAESLRPWFSDNFFDLCGGHSRRISVETSTPVHASDLRIGHWKTEWE